MSCTSDLSGRRQRCPSSGITKVELNDHRLTPGSYFRAAPAFPLPIEFTSDAIPSGVTSIELTGGAAGDTMGTCGFCATQFTGNGGNDVITGSVVEDVVTPGRGADFVVGGGGSDQVRYDDGRSAGVRVEIGAAGTQGGPEDGPAGARDALTGFESVVGTPFDDVLLGCTAGFPLGCRGLAGNDTLTGTDAVERLEGGPGNDTLTGRGGTDDLLAEDGDDIIFAKDGVVDNVYCGAGTDNRGAVDAGDALTECEPPFVLPIVPSATPTPRPAPSATPTPSPKPRPARVKKPTIKGRFKARKRTRVRILQVRDLVAGSSLVVTCSGPRRSCAFKKKRRSFKKATAKATLTGLFRKRRLRPGTRIKVTVTTPGRAKTTFRFRIRKGKAPKRS